MDEQLDNLVRAVLASAKYRAVDPGLVRRVGARELATRRNLKTAIKATKNALHQVGGAFIDAPIDYNAARNLLQASAADPQTRREACRRIMHAHTSTRERLTILDEFFTTTLEGMPPPARVLDIACGLNPLARDWMPFPAATEYLAYDIYSDQVAFLNDYFALAAIPGGAQQRDVVGHPPDEPADLAFILKTLPCLEAVDRHASQRLLDGLRARFLLVSFPAQSLGGRRKGMVDHYESRFRQLIEVRGWPAQRFEFATELAFLVETR